MKATDLSRRRQLLLWSTPVLLALRVRAFRPQPHHRWPPWALTPLRTEDLFFFANKFKQERMANRLKTVDDLVSELNSNGVSKVVRAQLRPRPALLKKSKGSSSENSLTDRMTQDPEMVPDGKGDDGHRKYALVFSDERWCVRRCLCRLG